jgi:hypothetical protein
LGAFDILEVSTAVGYWLRDEENGGGADVEANWPPDLEEIDGFIAITVCPSVAEYI